MKKIAKKHLLKIYPLLNFMLKLVIRRGISEDTFFKMVKHYSVSTIAVIFNYTIFNFLFFSGFGTKASNTIAFLIVFLIAFTLQRNFTYRSNGNSKRQVVLFLMVALTYLVIETSFLTILIDKFNVFAMVSKIITIAILAPLNFVFQKNVVFNSNHSELSGYLHKNRNVKKD